MLINRKNYLLLRRRGCNFWKGDDIAEKSDVGNYRVFVELTDKDGVKVCGDFSRGYKFNTGKQHQRSKKPDIVRDCVLCSDLQYLNSDGFCYCYRPAVDCGRFDYTINGILSFVNSISAEQYDGIKFVEYIETTQPAGKNFTPRDKMLEYATAHGIEMMDNGYFCDVLRLRTGDYKYMSYDISPLSDGTEKVTLTLELVV